MSSGLISENDGVVTLANSRGCKVVLAPVNGQYGLGRFFFNDRAVGPRVPHIVKMGDKFENSANPWLKVHNGRWTPHHYGQTTEVVHNSPEKAVVKLSGRTGFLDVSATYTMSPDSTGIAVDVTASPFRCNIWWPLFASVPFQPQAMEFVQVPFEVPLRSGENRRWAVTMRKWIAPLMLACCKSDGRDIFVAAGYHLEQDRLKECLLEYAPDDEDGALRVYFPGRTFARAKCWMTEKKTPDHYLLKMVVALGETQAECVEGYRDACGYDVSIPAGAEIEDSLDKLFVMYRDCKAYVSVSGFKNKAYKQQITPDGQDLHGEGYGRFVPIGVNVQLAYQFYLRYLARPEEKWLKDRAFNMAGFFCESQKPSGAVPTLYWPDGNDFWTYNCFIKEAGFIYAMCQMSMGAYNLHRLAAAVEEHEGGDRSEWRATAIKAMDFVVEQQRRDDFLGRSYSDLGRCDDVAAPNWPLIALDYFDSVTGDDKYARARDSLEKWTMEYFARPNLWFGWSTDGGNLDLEPSCFNTDILDTFSFVTYCIYRHRRTGDAKYLQAAEDVFAYVWACSIPVQYPGYKHLTKALSFEQLSYQCFDLPFRTCLLVDCLPYMAAATGKRFYADYYRLMVQTQLAYQMEPPWAAFHIGLHVDSNELEPADDLGEKGNKYIVEFASLYLEAQQSLLNYRYVGGPGWNVGMDYDANFKLGTGKAEPYVIASSHRLVDAEWDAAKKSLGLSLEPRPGWPGELLVAWGKSSESVSKVVTSENGKDRPGVTLDWNAQTGVATVHLPRTSAERLKLTLSASHSK